MRHPIWPILAMLFVAGGNPALASDGALESNQACATSSAGCFPGDAGGFPVTIAARGSYRLTSDLDLSAQSANIPGVQISAQWVTLDLGGFSIYGPVACSGIPTTSCSLSGSGVGVLAGNSVTVRNGSVTGFASDGVRVFGLSEVEGIHAFSNGGSGIAVTGGGGGALVRGNLAISNGAHGISADVEATLDRNTAVGNQTDGFQVTSGVLTDNVASRNGGLGAKLGGLLTEPNVSFSGNTFKANVAGSIAGGRATGGNSCDDGKCTRTGARRFYLTKTTVNGAGVLGACSIGFHMASIREVFDTSSLLYDPILGQTQADSAGGPPNMPGWIHTGNASFGSGAAGLANCDAWTSPAAGNDGTEAILLPDWTGPWTARIQFCSTPNRVWCVED